MGRLFPIYRSPWGPASKKWRKFSNSAAARNSQTRLLPRLAGLTPAAAASRRALRSGAGRSPASCRPAAWTRLQNAAHCLRLAGAVPDLVAQQAVWIALAWSWVAQKALWVAQLAFGLRSCTLGLRREGVYPVAQRNPIADPPGRYLTARPCSGAGGKQRALGTRLAFPNRLERVRLSGPCDVEQPGSRTWRTASALNRARLPPSWAW